MGKITSPLSAFTYFAKSHPGDICGTNGLPLTPNSIVILGRSQILKTIKHENLCEYLDIIRSKHGKPFVIKLKIIKLLRFIPFQFIERTIIVSEYIGTPLSEKPVHSYDDILKIFYQIANGLSHIESLDFTMHTLEPKNVLIDELGNVKLFNYGMFYQTNQGEFVTFPIGLVSFYLVQFY